MAHGTNSGGEYLLLFEKCVLYFGLPYISLYIWCSANYTLEKQVNGA